MSAQGEAFCDHCLLPLGRRPLQRRLNGTERSFCCYGCCIAYQVKEGRSEEAEAAWLLIRLGVAAFLSMNIMLVSLFLYTGAISDADAYLLPWAHGLLFAFTTPAIVLLGGPFLQETFERALAGRLTSSALIVVGVASAYFYSFFAMLKGAHVYFDTAAMVLLLFTLGRYLEAAARANAARDLEPLLAAESEFATVVLDGVDARRPAREVMAGMLVRVLPGERIPVDGLVCDGESNVDEAVITGESRLLHKAPGAPVIAGSVNFDGFLLIRSSGAGSDTQWARICRSVRDALSHRSPTQCIADQIVTISVPIVLVLSGLTAAYWAQSLPLDQAMLTGLAVLVVACPCAVGLAAPLATTLGIGQLARRGCLVRDPGVLEALAGLKCVAFDKTGTLTAGKPTIVEMERDGVEAADVLSRASNLAQYSDHALAKAVTATASANGVRPVPAQDVRIIPGRGIVGTLGGEAIAAGSALLMGDLGWPLSSHLTARARAAEADGHSLILVGWRGRVRALLLLDDTPQPAASATIGALESRGMHPVLLTGDLHGAAQRIAATVGIAQVEAALSPDAKRLAVHRLRQTRGMVAMVGDGLNDGPVLADADVGIAVGSATDLARAAAALVLPDGGLWLLPWVVDVARAVRRTILTNLLWAFGYNFIALTAAALGLLQPILAAAVMAGSSILVVMNSIRLLRLPEPVSSDIVGPQEEFHQEFPPNTSAVKAEYQPTA